MVKFALLVRLVAKPGKEQEVADTPEAVASSAITGLLDKKIDVFMGGEQMQNNRKLNFDNPVEYDEKVKSMYDAMFIRASKHRAM